MTHEPTPRQAASWFASCGYKVLPLHSITDAGSCTCGRPDCESPGKHPFAPIAPHGLKDAVDDVDTVRGWFAENYWLNFGVCTDPFLVIDVDVRHGGLKAWADICSEPTRALIHTWQVRTGSGGLHVFFKNPNDLRNGAITKGIDVRGVGGYVVGPTSRHASGKRYAWLPQCTPKEAPLIEPPVWLVTMLELQTHCGRVMSTQEWRKIAGTRLEEGERNTTLLRLAGHLISNPLNDPVVIRPHRYH